MKTPLFYKQKPSFGIDIGHGTVKVVQLFGRPESIHLAGYGYESFDPSAISDKGVVLDVGAVAKSTYQLLTNNMIGNILTDSIVATIPSAHTYTRILELPKMDKSELEGAVRLEAEQYIPVPLQDLYIDYQVTDNGPVNEKGNQEILMVAAPSNIVDSYMNVFSALDLEVQALEPSLTAITRAVAQAYKIKDTAMIIDLGSRSSDLSIYDGKTIRVAGTTNRGGEDITDILVKKLGITKRQAYHGKARYGIKQNTKQGKEILNHSRPILDDLVGEAKKLARYYARRNEESSLDEILLIGGGANMPGLDEYLNKLTGMKTTLCNPWVNIKLSKLQAPNQLEATIYTTALGNALVNVQGMGSAK